MNIKDKALELINMFRGLAHTNTFSFREESNWNNSKKCALIVVSEIIKELESVEFNYDLQDSSPTTCLTETSIPYWKEVATEIKNLPLPLDKEKLAKEKIQEEKKAKEELEREKKEYDRLKIKFENGKRN